MIGHEALHNAGLSHNNERPPYRFGSAAEKIRYDEITIDKRHENPDWVMSEVYP